MAGRFEQYKEDFIIIHEGEVNDKMYVVNEGSVVLYMNYGSKDEYVMGVCGKNKVFGEDSMLTGEPSRYTAVAFEDSTITWLQENMLSTFFKDCPEYAINIMKKFAFSNRMYVESIMRILEETIDEKKRNDNSQSRMRQIDSIAFKASESGVKRKMVDVSSYCDKDNKSVYRFSSF